MAKKKIFMDMEFTGLHKLATPISIAMTSEDGKEFYAEFNDFDKEQVTDFLREKVLSQLNLRDYDFSEDYQPDSDLVLVKGNVDTVKNTLIKWLNQYEDNGVEIWGDLSHYYWIQFVSVFGNAFDLPKHVHPVPMEFSTALRVCRVDPNVDRHEFAKVKRTQEAQVHNSLYDARLLKSCYIELLEMFKSEKDSDSDSDSDSEKEDITDNSQKVEVINQPTDNETNQEVSETGSKNEFVEPTQDMINNGGEDFNAPI